MRARKALLALTLVVLVLAAAAGGAFVWLKKAPRRTPSGQPALSRLDARTLPALRNAFNEAADRARVILLLSPT